MRVGIIIPVASTAEKSRVDEPGRAFAKPRHLFKPAAGATPVFMTPPAGRNRDGAATETCGSDAPM